MRQIITIDPESLLRHYTSQFEVTLLQLMRQDRHVLLINLFIDKRTS